MKLSINLKKILKLFFNLFPLSQTILFESIPDISDNSRAVFDELIKRGFNNKYKMIWIVDKKDLSYPKIHNVRYISNNSKFKYWYRITSRCFISCNRWLYGLRKGQIAFWLSHSTTLKSVCNYYYMPQDIDYCFAAGEGVVSLCEHEFHAEKKKIVPLGFPRNDILTNANVDLKSLFPEVLFEKAVVWYPTFRQHKNGYSVSSNMLPIIGDEKQAKQLNESAAENKILIVLKPHFAQDIQYIRKLNLSNIKFIDDSFFEKQGISSYEFVGSCDALITDYSSIYFDYTLCDKPIALIWQDYEEYKINPGLAVGVEKYLIGGEKIYSIEQLQEFLKNIANGIDVLKKERNAVCEQVNYSKDGKNTERVVNFIIDKAKL